MYIDSCPNLDSMLTRGLTAIRDKGVSRKPAWQRCSCMEIPEPVILELTNPLARFCTLSARKQNIPLAIAESVWVLAGLNDLDVLPGHYAKSIYEYSDDDRTYRAGYGPRVRFYNGSLVQYDIDHKSREYLQTHYQRGAYFVDQLRFCVEQLSKDRFTRQAVITIHDPYKDDFQNGELLSTKDTPCTRSIQFMCDSQGNLNCYVHMRSNDILYGMSAINVAEFTFMQQIVGLICSLPLGRYYHIVNNLHYYEDVEKIVEGCLSEDTVSIPGMENFHYDDYRLSLEGIDEAIDTLISYENTLFYDGKLLNSPNPFYGTNLKIFSDYAEVFRISQCHKQKVPCENVRLSHPQLQYLYSQGRIK